MLVVYISNLLGKKGTQSLSLINKLIFYQKDKGKFAIKMDREACKNIVLVIINQGTSIYK